KPPPPGNCRQMASRGGTVWRPLGRIGRPDRSVTTPAPPDWPPLRPRAGWRTRSKLHRSASGLAPPPPSSITWPRPPRKWAGPPEAVGDSAAKEPGRGQAVGRLDG